MIGPSTGSASNAINKIFLTVSTCFIFPQRKPLGCGPNLPSRVYVTIKNTCKYCLCFQLRCFSKRLSDSYQYVYFSVLQSYESYQFLQIFTHQCSNYNKKLYYNTVKTIIQKGKIISDDYLN